MFQAIWSAARRYVRLLFDLVSNERQLEMENPHKLAFVRQLRSLLDGRVKQFMCKLKTTMIAAGIPRRKHNHYQHSHQPGCNVDHTRPTSTRDKTHVALSVLHAFVNDFLQFCLNDIDWSWTIYFVSHNKLINVYVYFPQHLNMMQ